MRTQTSENVLAELKRLTAKIWKTFQKRDFESGYIFRSRNGPPRDVTNSCVTSRGGPFFLGLLDPRKKQIFQFLVKKKTQKYSGKRIVCRQRHAFLMEEDRSMFRKVNEELHTSRGGLKLSHG